MNYVSLLPSIDGWMDSFNKKIVKCLLCAMYDILAPGEPLMKRHGRSPAL
jgi:hypothetical protein